MSEEITTEVIASHGLSSAEYERIRTILEREPNMLELGIFSVMWSEHCSYKSSRVHLRKFPTTGTAVIHGPGENAGVIDIGHGWVAVFKMESHNHPSYIEPYQGAATGVGGILRDVFTMGARPIALLDSLRFGSIDAPRMRYLVDGVVRGIAGYGNCVGIPTVGGETTFYPSYDGNILVNAFALGVAPAKRIFLGKAEGVGNPVIYAGSKTGRDGIHGATMASAEFDAESEEKRPTVQVGDPFTEKLLLEACLELMEKDVIVGIQDMGAAGLTSSSFEMAGRSGTGVRLDLDLVPMREEGMTPYELMLSESQERMLIVAERGREQEVIDVFHKWELDAATIGEVTDTGFVELRWEGETAGMIPVGPIASEAPVYERPIRKPARADSLADRWNRPDEKDTDRTLELLELLGSPNLCSKRWIHEQYDSTVRTNTIVGAEQSDAAVLRVKETGVGLAITSDVNPLYCFLDPAEGGRQAVAEAARNIACSGAKPVAITDCLNFGSPEKPEIMWEFSEAVRGISEACEAFGTPVVSGNVSFYNETEGRAIYPTPTVAMVGLMSDPELRTPLAFQNTGAAVVLLGETYDEMGGSEYLCRMTEQSETVRPPRVDLEAERRLVELLPRLREIGLTDSAHDVSSGGLAIAIAESSMKGIGCEIELKGVADSVDATALLFGESQARAIVSCRSDVAAAVVDQAGKAGVAARQIGTTTQGSLKVTRDGATLVDTTIEAMERIWSQAFEALLAGSSVDEIIEGHTESADLITH